MIFADPLDDDRVEWSVVEKTSIIGTTEWDWVVSVDGKSQGYRAWTKSIAVRQARAAARLLLGEGQRLGKTRPCPLCGKPSQAGRETDTEECARLLSTARAELPKAVL